MSSHIKKVIVSPNWSLDYGTNQQNVSPHAPGAHQGIRCVIIMPDGQTAMSESGSSFEEGAERGWDLASGQCLAIFRTSGEVSTLSEISTGRQFGIGAGYGQVVLVTLRNVPFAPSCITAVRLWLSGTDGAQCRWDDELTTRYAHCGQPFVSQPSVLDAIHDLTAHLTLDQSPSLELPPEVWDDPRLLVDCPQCHQPVGFNPFVVDQRDRASRASTDSQEALVEGKARPWWKRLFGI